MASKKRQYARKPAAKALRTTGNVLREGWTATLAALTSAEQELQKQVTLLMKNNKLSAKDAGALLKQFSTRFDKERRKAVKQLESRVKTLQVRVKKERKAVGHAVDDAVHRALSAFNIPSRREVAELTRKVDELTHKIDRFRR